MSAGADFTSTDLAFYDAELITLLGLDAFRAQPRRYGAFASDRIALGSLLLDLGVRYDHFTPGGDFPRTPGFVSLDPNWNPDAATNDTAYANSVARVFQPAQGQGTVSPRLRAAYTVSPRTSVRAAYGQQVEPPSFDVLFRNSNANLTFTTTPAQNNRIPCTQTPSRMSSPPGRAGCQMSFPAACLTGARLPAAIALALARRKAGLPRPGLITAGDRAGPVVPRGPGPRVCRGP